MTVALSLKVGSSMCLTAAAKELDFIGAGLTEVRVQVID